LIYIQPKSMKGGARQGAGRKKKAVAKKTAMQEKIPGDGRIVTPACRGGKTSQQA
jgi:hypothetical protein